MSPGTTARFAARKCGHTVLPYHPSGDEGGLRARRTRRERGQSVVEFALVLPLMLVVLLAILDFARIYTTMMSVESAAREAADYGTTLGAGKWQVGAPADATVAEMQKRACIAASDLPDYQDPDGDPATGCEQPDFDYCLTAVVGGPCGPVDPGAGCENPMRRDPCTVTVTLTHDFQLIAPFNIEFFGVRIGVPSSITLPAGQHLRDDRHRPLDRRHDPTIALDRSPVVARPRSGARRVRARRPDVLPAPVRDHRGRPLHPLLRDPQQRDARGCPVRDRQRRQHASAARPARPRPEATSCDPDRRRRRERVRQRRVRRPGTGVTVTTRRGTTRQQRARLDGHGDRHATPTRASSRSCPCHRSPSTRSRALLSTTRPASRADQRAGPRPLRRGPRRPPHHRRARVRRRDDARSSGATSRTRPTRPPLPVPASCSRSEADAEAAARRIAPDNGFDDAEPTRSSTSTSRPIHGRYAGLPGFIEVQIEATRPSIFGGIIGQAAWPVGAFAVATNSQDLTFPFSMLALDPTAVQGDPGLGWRRRRGVREHPVELQRCRLRRATRSGFSRTGGGTITVDADDVVLSRGR